MVIRGFSNVRLSFKVHCMAVAWPHAQRKDYSILFEKRMCASFSIRSPCVIQVSAAETLSKMDPLRVGSVLSRGNADVEFIYASEPMAMVAVVTGEFGDAASSKEPEASWCFNRLIQCDRRFLHWPD